MFSKRRIFHKDKRYSMAIKDYFEKLDIRMGKITEVIDTTLGDKAAYKLTINFGEAIGNRQTILKITENYSSAQLLNKYVVCVVNFPPENIQDQNVDVFLLGMPDDIDREIFLTSESHIPEGEKVYLIE
jgi:tRNA-binding protein